MMEAGFLPRRRGIFGSPLGMPDKPQEQASPYGLGMQGFAPTTKPQPISTGRMIAGVIGDSIAQWAGGQAQFLPALNRMRQAQIEEQRQATEMANRRTADRDEWTWREQWKRDHADDPFTNYMRSGGIDPASPEGQKLYRQRAESMAAPPLMAIDGFDAQGNPTKTFMPRTGLTGGQSPAAAGPAIGTIRNGYRFQGGDPNNRNSWVPVGGASPRGGATFR